MPPERKRKLIVCALLALSGPVIGTVAGLRGWSGAIWYQIEVCFLLLFVLFTVYRGESRAYLDSLAPRYRGVACGALLILLFAQGLGSYSATFPFVPWRMYQGGKPPKYVTLFETYGVGSDGEFRLNPARLFMSNGMGTRRMPNRLARVMRDMLKERESGKAERSAEQKAVDLMRAIGEKHNRKHKDQPIREVRVIRSEVDWRKQGEIKKERSELILSVPLSRGES